MKIVVDECIAQSTSNVLIKHGFEVLSIDQILTAGVTDEEIYSYVSKNNLPILTHDRRFGQIFYEYSELVTTTIVLAVVPPQPKGSNELLIKFLRSNDLSSPKFINNLIIIFPNKIRIRKKS